MKHLVIMAAGTGGHVMPGLAVAAEMQRRGWSVSWLGTTTGMENRLVPKAGLALDRIAFAGLRGKGLVGNLRGALQMLAAFGTSLFSMPPGVPSQLTLQPRRCISAATARPGITCPPVPAAITTRCFMRALRA